MSLQVIINGIATGSIYALIVHRLCADFQRFKVSNFSHGATMTAAAFIAYFLVSSKGMGLVPTLLIAGLAGALISLFGEFVGFRRILKNHSAPTYFFVSPSRWAPCTRVLSPSRQAPISSTSLPFLKTPPSMWQCWSFPPAI